MAYKFLRGDTVRQVGTNEDFTVDHANETGDRYLLTDNPNSIAPQKWASEDELEMIKRASDSETGWKLWYIA